MTPLFSVLHPSARPHKWRGVYDAWIKAAAHPENVEYVLCADERWGFPPTNQRHFMEELCLPHRIVWNTGRRCYVDSVNIAAKASTGRILIVIADDQYPCEKWDERILTRLSSDEFSGPSAYILDGKPNPAWDCCGEFVLEVSTGTPNEHDRQMMPMPILSRARYKRLGYVFYPAYESMYADNDVYEHAKQDGCIIDSRHLMFPHRHPIVTHGMGSGHPEDQNYWDDAYQAQNREEAYQIGDKILAWRRRVQFGRKIDEAERIPGWMTREELEALSFWSSEHKNVIEIGSYKGRSAYALGVGCAGRVISIDSDPLVQDEFEKNTEGTGVWWHQDDSVNTASYWPDADMVFIDGGHSYEQVKADLYAWTPKTKAFICGHDYNWEDAAGVVRAVHERFGDAVRIGPGRLWSVSLPYGPNGATGDPSTATFHEHMKQRPSVRRNIAIALPGENFSGIWVAKLLEILFNIQKTWNFTTIINYTSNASITRQTICQQIQNMAPGFEPEFILWIDDDQIVEAGIVDMLLTDAEAFPDADLIAGWTWIASSGAHHNEPQVSCGRMNLERGELSHAEYRSVQSANGVFEVHWTGFPIVLMRYSALAKVGKHPFAHYPCPQSPWGECGEDISFCKRLQDAGGKIYVDSRAFVPHMKQKPLGPSPPSKDEVALSLSGLPANGDAALAPIRNIYGFSGAAGGEGYTGRAKLPAEVLEQMSEP